MNELAVDIRTLSTALAKISSQTSLPRSAFLVEDDFQAEPYNHVATLLTRGDADEARGQAVVAVTGLYTPTGFSFLGVAKSPLSFRTTSPTSSPLNVTTSAFSSTTPSAPTVDRVNIEHDKPADLDLGVARNLKSGIDAESLSSKIILQKIEAEDGRSLEQIFETGCSSVDLAQHITDIKHILVQYPSMDTTTQLKARVFILTRSIRKIAQRFKNPSKFFTTDSRPWWELLSQCEPELDDPVQFRLDQARATIWEIFVPGTIDATNRVQLDTATAAKCMRALQRHLATIHESLVACEQQPVSPSTWNTLDMQLRVLAMLISQNSKKCIVMHIMCNTNLSQAISMKAKSYLAFSGDGETEDSILEDRDGVFLFRQLQNMVAWHDAIYRLSSSVIIRRHVPIDLCLVLVPPPATTMSPLMQLVREALPNHTQEQVRLLESHFQSAGLIDGTGTTLPYEGSVHCEATLMGIMTAMHQLDVNDPLVGAATENASEIWSTRDNLSHTIGVAKKCCYTCSKLASLLNTHAPLDPPLRVPGSHGIIHPWSPPFGIPDDILRLLRSDLMEHLQRHTESLVSRTCQSNHSSPSWSDVEWTEELDQEEVLALAAAVAR